MMSSRSNQIETAETPIASSRPLRWGAIVIWLSVLGVFGLTGCSPFRGLREYIQYNDASNDFVMGWRNSVWARQAWHERKHQHYGEPQFIAFGQGFRDGYADVASGGSGCVPPLPPRSYWTWKYQTGEGQAKVAAWFAGYPHGAAAAKEDGAGNFQQIQVSHLIEAEYSPEFQKGFCPGCDPNQLPNAPGAEVLPDAKSATPVPIPTPTSALPADNSTSQVLPAGGWQQGMMTRIPRTAPAYFPSIHSAVVPASAEIPIQ